MEVWAKRIGVAFVMAFGGAFILWIVGVLLVLLAEWLSQTIPAPGILVGAGILFVLIVIIDWQLDAYDKRDKRGERDVL
jgi:hypothetical protein